MIVINYIKRTWSKWSEDCRIEDEKCRKGRAILNARGETFSNDLLNIAGMFSIVVTVLWIAAIFLRAYLSVT